MRVNFYVEDQLFFKYIGSSTVAKTLYRQIAATSDIEVSWKSYSRTADIVHYHTFGPIAALNRKISCGCKVLTAHSTPRINQGNIAFAKVINKRYPKVYRKYDHIITISKSCHDEVTRMVPEVPVTMIPNGVNREVFRKDQKKRMAFREEYGIENDERVVLSVAQQTPRKGFYDFSALSKNCPDIRWVWVGGLPYGFLSKDYRKIRFMSERCGKNVILLTHHIRDVVNAYNGADVFFMPSYAETFGLVILEALSCGLPVVARDIPEFRDIFGDNILYFSDNEEAGMMVNDEPALRRIASGARDFTRTFDIGTIAKKHIDLYQSLVEP
jgi:1,2-diacylglycerol-3-alpha-glucose alpha-1,2-galactosyltransferase